MNKLFLGIAMLLSAQATFADNGNFTVKGELKNFGDTIIAFVPVNKDYVRDTILVKNNKFEAKLNVAEPSNIYLMSPGTMRRTESKRIVIPAVPGEIAVLTGDVTTRYDISGSMFYKQYGEFDRALETATKPMKDYEASLDKRIAAGEDRGKIMDEYEAKAPEFEKAITSTIFSFIKGHANWEASAVAVTNLDADTINSGVALLAANVKNGRMKPFYQSVLDQYKAKAEREAKSKAAQASGVMAPDFTLNDINGKPLTLSSLRGKYVLLDFWGSWCIWCIKGMPQMKEYYKKYAGKFEILGVDCNDTEAKWKEAVQKHELPWLHVYCPKGSNAIEGYAIQGFPTKILIGPDGKIVKTIVGEDPAFYKFLDDTFSK